MTEVKNTSWRDLLVDKQEIRLAVAEMNLAMGFVPDQTITARKVQAMMIELGIRPDDNMFSCGIIAAREEE